MADSKNLVINVSGENATVTINTYSNEFDSVNVSTDEFKSEDDTVVGIKQASSTGRPKR